MAGIDDVLDDEHMFALDVSANVHDKPHGTRGPAATAVAGDGDELDRARNRQLAGEVRKEHKCALENSHHDQVVRGLVICGDLRRELGDTHLDFLFAYEYNWKAHG